MSYNDIINHVLNQEDKDIMQKFKCIVSNEVPLIAYCPNYKVLRYNFMVYWDTGYTTTEPIDNITSDDPVTCAMYADENNLLQDEVWKIF